jgi:dihydroorotase-like cyclic amidohydrolase
MKLLIRNGKVCFENAIEAADILVENGKVAALGPFHDAIRSAKMIDTKGLFVLPGLRPHASNALIELAQRIATAPAKAFRIYPQKGTIKVGSDADLSIVDVHGQAKPIQSSLVGSYETYSDQSSTLDFKYVLVRGEVVVSNNQLLEGSLPGGACLCRN